MLVVTMATHLAIDIGGTFIDTTVVDESGEIEHVKTPSEEVRLVDGIRDSFDALGISLPSVERFTHGTTIGLNAVLERDGAKVGLLTNEHFTDVLEIGRAQVAFDQRYDVKYRKPEPLVPRRRRIGIEGRIDADGTVVQPLDDRNVRESVTRLVDEQGVDAIAVCLLHAYENPVHEQRIADIAADLYPDVPVSVSTDISREYREYERTSTAVVDAYVKPAFGEYVGRMVDALVDDGFDGSFLITRSGGGALPAEEAATSPVDTIFSGPAGGIIGASYIASTVGRDDVISFDMGGTSLDACIVSDGEADTVYESVLESFPITTAAYDIRTIGAGGGSIAWRDGSILKVGPESAGADPGPICYGWGGTRPTFTDAALELGFLDEDAFLGGSMTLDGVAARTGLREKLAEPLAMTLPEVCRGIFEVTKANTVGTIREMTVEKGMDPREFTLVAYGGAGPMLAPLIAREMAIDAVLVPRVPSVFSAWGMLLTDIVYDFAHTVVQPLEHTSRSELEAIFEDLEASGERALREEGVDKSAVVMTRELEMRYVGQEHSVTVAVDDTTSMDDVRERFASKYRDRYNHTMDNAAEVVTLRVRAVGENDAVELPRIQSQAGEPSPTGTVDAYCFATESFESFDVYERDRFGAGATIDGPAIVREPSTTVVFFSDQRATVDEYGQLLVE